MQAQGALFTATLLSPGQMSDAHGALRSELSRGKTLHEALLKEVHTCCQHILGHTRRGGLTMDSEGGVHALYAYIITYIGRVVDVILMCEFVKLHILTCTYSIHGVTRCTV